MEDIASLKKPNATRIVARIRSRNFRYNNIFILADELPPPLRDESRALRTTLANTGIDMYVHVDSVSYPKSPQTFGRNVLQPIARFDNKNRAVAHATACT